MNPFLGLPVPFYIPPKLSHDQLTWIENCVGTVLQSGQITNGENVREFEERIKELHKVEHAIACSSCSQGLWTVLEALKPENLMIQAFTWQSLKYVLPLRPVTYSDINPETWLMNPRVRSSWGYLPRAVIYTHTFGNMGVATVETEQEKVIYDGAYSLGAELPDIGDATVLSTTATKTITSCEGGIILTNTMLAEEMTEIRDKCSRMSEINAIVGLAYLEMLPKILARKKAIFEYYSSHLPFKPQRISRWGTSYGYYGCLVPNRDEIAKKLEGKVETRVRYEPLVKGLPATDDIASKILILPCYPSLDEQQVVQIIKECLE